MKNLFTIIALLCSFYVLPAQVNFQEFSNLDELFLKAQSENKLIFLQIESAECRQCNDVAMMSLNSSLLKEKYSVNFISVRVEPNSTLYNSIKNKYGQEKITASIYLDSKGNVLLSQNITTSNTTIYLNWADKAIVNYSKSGELNSLEQSYIKGNRALSFLEKYILLLRELDKDSDGLMEEYITHISSDSLCNPRIYRFILEQSLPLHSDGRKIINNSCLNIKDSLWNSLGSNIASQINSRIINKTYQKAINTKNKQLMEQLANFIKDTHRPNKKLGDFVAIVHIVNFHKATKDTSLYLISANRFANTLLMTTSDDSLKLWDREERELIFSQRVAERRIIGMSTRYATELNNLAFSFFSMTKDTFLLKEALSWVKRAMEIQANITNAPSKENPAFLDTYAHLLYKLNEFEEAILWQTKAIEVQKAYNMNTSNFEIVLEKMKNRKL